MNKAWPCAALALMLSGCTLPFPLWQQQPESQYEAQVPSDAQQLQNWLVLSTIMQHSNDAERQHALAQLQHTTQDELKRALWLSHPGASISQRQQAQQLFQRHLAKASLQEQRFLSLFQNYNQELLLLQRQSAQRQQQVDRLTRKLKELASIDQQINRRKFQE